MAKIDGSDKVVQALKARLADAASQQDVSGVVGYTQMYSLYVHENLEAHHPVGQAKFLETPFRENMETYRRILTNAAKRGISLSQSILLACLQLQRDSQKLVPVDTGALRASAFTRLEKGA